MQLLDNSAAINKVKDNGWTALMAAAQHGHPECVSVLLEAGADATLRKTDGCTALSLAEENARLDVARILRAHLNMRAPADPFGVSGVDAYPDGRTMRLEAARRKQARRPQSAPAE